MKITHKLLHKKITRELSNDAIFRKNISLFLMNKKGSYIFLPSDPSFNISNYQGWFSYLESTESKNGKKEYSLYKSIENIYIDKKPTEIVNNFVNVERIYDKSTERFTLLRDVLIYDVENHNGFVNIDFDFRDIFDFDDKGRIYKIYKEEIHDKKTKDEENKDGKNNDEKNNSEKHKITDLLVVEYTKYKDAELKTLDKKYYLVIKGISDAYELLNRWERKIYQYDLSRNSRCEYHIFKALKVLCRNNLNLIFSFSDKKEKAIDKIKKVIDNMKNVETSHKEYFQNVLVTKEKISSACGENIAFAYANSVNALKSLNVDLDINNKKLIGLWAGLPWFFQFWSRDELVSDKALMLEQKYINAKEVILRYLKEITAEGRLPNRYPSAFLESVDSIGWLFKRTYDFLILLEERNEEFDNFFNLYNLKYVRERLQFSIKKILKLQYKDGLIFNDKKETWMDTQCSVNSIEEDLREGFRIEVQCLFLATLKLANLLNNLLANKFIKQSDKLVNITQNEFDYAKLERDFRDLVRQRFLVDINGKKFLNDGYNCSYHDVARPNVFLAYYIYPELLSEKEWQDVFDIAIGKLWCEWKLDEKNHSLVGGGFSTIDKSHKLYCAYHTGENNKSYHRGDSWFYINNMAAICLHKVNKSKYKHHIEKILNASTEDILFNGFIGYASELSSSAEFKSFGCLCQTWSVATFIELIHELYVE